MDRPGPALQMVRNFVLGRQNYSEPTGLNIDLQPLLDNPKNAATAQHYYEGILGLFSALLIVVLQNE